MDGPNVGSRVQLCGTYALEIAGRDVAPELRAGQSRALAAYLILHRPHPVGRDALVDALWGDTPPRRAADALTTLVSRLRSVLGPEVVRGRSELSILLPDPADVDVEQAFASLHLAESAVASEDWQRAWFSSLAAIFVARRRLLPDVEGEWLEPWRRRLADARLRALETYSATCLALGGPELPAAERSAREIVEVAPLRETGHLLLMRALATRGNTAEALAAYDALRALLREELGVDPSPALQETYRALLG